MNAGPARQSRLVAAREMRERSRTRAFRISLLLMVLVVVAVIVIPSLLEQQGGTKDVGVTGAVPKVLPHAIAVQGEAVDITTRVHRYRDVASGERAVRDGRVDVLVDGTHRLVWRRQADEQLQAVVTGAIQLVALQQRAAAAGIDPGQLAAVVTPVRVDNVELGGVEGRTPDDETAAFVMTVLLFIAISTYGNLVLTGVVEEKSSRVVEVLLARMPARNLLAGKVVGIGVLGLGQIAVTGVAALVAIAAVDSVDAPSVRGSVIAWMVVWFVLGYALFAMVYGALGSLASRTEDAQSAAGPVQALLIAGYFLSFAAIGRPESGFARVLSWFPVTAPLAMPNRIAMGAVAWWEPVGAVLLIVATIAALVEVGGRVYARAILHSGPALKLRDVWRAERPHGPFASRPRPPRRRMMHDTWG
jgi:ABC-2 type transport system permease protein